MGKIPQGGVKNNKNHCPGAQSVGVTRISIKCIGIVATIWATVKYWIRWGRIWADIVKGCKHLLENCLSRRHFME